MRLPNLSPSIDRRIPGSPPAGPGRGAVRPQGPQTCGEPCNDSNPCPNQLLCECQNGKCVPKQP